MIQILLEEHEHFFLLLEAMLEINLSAQLVSAEGKEVFSGTSSLKAAVFDGTTQLIAAKSLV